MTDTDTGVFEKALLAERARSAEQVARLRFVAVTSIFVLNLGFAIGLPTYIGPPLLPLGLYSAAAAALLVARRRSKVAARWSDLGIPLVDMPLAFLLIGAVIERLRATEYAVDAASVATQLPLFYLLLILGAASALEEWQTWLTSAVAIGLQTLLLVQQDRHPSFVAIVDTATLLATWGALYTRRRSVALVRAAALEQARRERLGRYFSPQVAEALAEGGSQIGRGETRDVTVLFADIRDFTRLSEQLTGDRVVEILNDFHTRMVERVFAAGGTLDKYLGDGLMAYFGAPVTQPDHAERALRCAREMHAALADLNRDLRRRGLPELRMGIGIHSGSVVLGDIGAARRREYTVIGDTVNVASRIEQLTKTVDAPILVSEETRNRLASGDGLAPVEPVLVKGKAHPLQTFRVEAGEP